MFKLFLISAASICLGAISFHASLAQESEAQPSQQPADQTSEPAQQTTAWQTDDQDQTAPRTTAKTQSANRRTLYFIGPKAPAQRQLGPAIGAPRSILPIPFVPKGSLALPAPPVEGATGTDQLPDTDQDQLDLDQPDIDQPEDTGVSAPAIAGLGQQNTDAPAGTTEQPNPFGGILQERSLERLDPSGIQVVLRGKNQNIDTVWQGYSRQDITAFLQRIQQTTTMPALRRLATAIAASRLMLPSPEQDTDVADTIKARLDVFQASGNASAYAALMNALPVDRDWSMLARHQARAHLLSGALTDACAVAENQRTIDVNAYWVRLGALCMAAAGDRAGVDFQLGILEETRSLDTTFYQLLDQILIEAERPAGAVIPEPGILTGPLKVNIVSAAMARLARVQITEIDSNDIDTLAARMLLQNPSVSQDIRIELLDMLLRHGIADEATLTAAARNFRIDPDVLQQSLAAVSADADGLALTDNNDNAAPSGSRDDDNEIPESETITPVYGKTLIQMTLLAAIAQEADLAQRTAALDRLWRISAADGKLAQFAPTISVLTNSWSSDEMSAASFGQVVRASILSGEDALSGRLRALRTRAAGEDAIRDDILLRLWPLIALHEGVSENQSPDPVAFQRWWAAFRSDDGSYRVANSLLTIFAGLGFDVPDQLWDLLRDGPVVFDGPTIAPVFWRDLLAGISANDPVATLGAAYSLFGAVQSNTIPPAVTGILIQGMNGQGFGESAKSIAADILISQGL